ncbi:MAG: acyl-CoA thioesterase [Flavihumibacter sp.]|nr:acyl-CoA thioesterase [Flavihumibacter sp.]
MNKGALSFTREIAVRFNEADPLGIVWHGHYVRYFEDGLDIYKHGYSVPVVKIDLDYKKSLKYGDRVIIETEFIPCHAAKLQFIYRLYNAVTKELVAKGSTTQVFLDHPQNNLQLINPPFFEAWKQKYLGAG